MPSPSSAGAGAVLSGRRSRSCRAAARSTPAHPLLASGAVVLTSERGARDLEGRIPQASTVVTLGDDVELAPRAVVSASASAGTG